MSIADRVYARTVKSDGCWEWQGATTHGGYGVLRVRGEYLRAHRVTLEAAAGAPPSPDMFALHRCDNPRCVNPDHLYWGDQAQNVRDACERGRAKGRQLAMTDEQAREAAALRKEGLSYQEIGKRLGFWHATVTSNLRRRELDA